MINNNQKGQWKQLLIDNLKRTFDKRLLLIVQAGGQNKQAAEDKEDIDVKVILNVVQQDDILAFRKMIGQIPKDIRVSGVLAGRDEIKRSPARKLLAFHYGAKVLYGNAEDVVPEITRKDIYVNTLVMLSYINDELRQQIINEQDLDKTCKDVKELYKLAFNVLTGWYLLLSGEYCGKMKDMLQKDITGEDSLIINRYLDWGTFKELQAKDPLETLFLLERWSSNMFGRLSEVAP